MVNIAHKVTKRLKRKVMLLVAHNVTQEVIAGVLKIDPVTLRKYYAHELAVGKQTIRDEIREMLYKAARKGNVSAQKYLDQTIEFDGASRSKIYEGKKAQQLADAKIAAIGTEWEADLVPTVKNELN